MKTRKKYYYLTEKTEYFRSGYGFSNQISTVKKRYFNPTPEILDELKENGIKVYRES